MENQTAQPNIFINKPPVTSTPPVFTPQGRKWLTPKNVFVVLGIVILIEIILGIKAYVGRSAQTVQTEPAVGGLVRDRGKITLAADKSSLSVGDVIDVRVDVSSPAPADGVDVLIKFDPTILEIKEADIHEGTIFPQFPLTKVDPKGTVLISGATVPGEAGFQGEGTLATVSFKALKPGKTALTLDFTPGQTADSNIVSGKATSDLLEEVGNLEVVIK